MPILKNTATINEIILEMTSKRLGCVGFIDEKGDFCGMFTDGDLRRCLNDNLKKVITKFPAYTENKAVDFQMAERLVEIWNVQGMHINPTDRYPCTFQDFYDKMIAKLGTDGNIYKSSSDTLSTTTASLENSRQQVLGVTSDEELGKLIKYQSAYNASSRYMTVISQMTELIVTGLI